MAAPGGAGSSDKEEGVTKSWAVIKMHQGLSAKARTPPPAKTSLHDAPASGASGTPRGRGGGGGGGGVDVADAQRGVKEELEGRSAYMKQVLADRAAFAPMIADLIPQIINFKPQDGLQVAFFTRELERRLALLSDERMVLKVKKKKKLDCGNMISRRLKHVRW